MGLVIECSSEPLSLGEGQRAGGNQEELWWTKSILLPRSIYSLHAAFLPRSRLMGQVTH